MSGEIHDYSRGEPRRHHAFYFEEADICIQVEKAIFKVHRFFLARRSVVLREMFQTPQSDGSQDGTDEKPLVFTGDSATGWEGLFQSIYSPNFLKSEETFSGQSMLAVLSLAHKYCMEPIEEEILSHFKKTTDKESFLNLMICSQIVGSTSLYNQAITGLVRYRTSITIEEARLIGLEAIHRIMISPESPHSSLVATDPFLLDLMGIPRPTRGQGRGS